MGAPCFGITPEDMGIYLATSDMIIGMSGIFFTDGPADARLAIRTFLGSAKEYWKKDFVWHFLSCAKAAEKVQVLRWIQRVQCPRHQAILLFPLLVLCFLNFCCYFVSFMPLIISNVQKHHKRCFFFCEYHKRCS
jgi:hypothetical protein